MAVIRTAESHTGTTGSVSQASFTFAVGQAGDAPKGVLVFVFQGVLNTDEVTSVTYGGQTVPAVTGGRAEDATTEKGSCESFFLGASVPSGVQSVVVNRSNTTTTMYAVAYLLGGASDLWVPVTPYILSNNAAMAQQSIVAGSGTTQIFAAAYSGGVTVPTCANMTIGTGTYLLYSSYAFFSAYETTPTTGTRTRGLTCATDDLGYVIVTVGEAPVATTLTAASTLTGMVAGSAGIAGPPEDVALTAASTLTSSLFSGGAGGALTVNSSAADGGIDSTNAAYATARSGGSLAAHPATAGLNSGQNTGYVCYSMFLDFDTAGIPAGATIDSVTYRQYCNASGNNTTKHVQELRAFDWGATLGAADWVPGESVDALTLCASIDTTSLSGVGYKVFTIEAGMAGSIVKGGVTRFLLCTDRFRLGTTPTTPEYLQWGTSEQAGGFKPELVVNYSLPGGAYLTSTPPADVTMTADSTLTALTAASASLDSASGPTLTAASTLTGFTSAAASLSHTPPAATTLTAASTLTGTTAGAATLASTAPPAKTITAASTLTAFAAAAASLSHTPPAAKTLTAASTFTGMVAGSAALSCITPTTLAAASTLTAFTAASASLSWTAPPAKTLTAASTLTAFTAGSASLSWTAAPAKTITAASTLTGFTSASASLSHAPPAARSLTASSTLTGVTAGSASIAWASGPVITAASTLTAFTHAAASLSHTAPPARSLTAASTLTAHVAAAASLANIAPAKTITGASTLTGRVSSSASLANTAPAVRTMTAASTLTAVVSASASLRSYSGTMMTADSMLTAAVSSATFIRNSGLNGTATIGIASTGRTRGVAAAGAINRGLTSAGLRREGR